MIFYYVISPKFPPNTKEINSNLPENSLNENPSLWPRTEKIMGTRCCTGPSVIAVSTEVNTEAVWTHLQQGRPSSSTDIE